MNEIRRFVCAVGLALVIALLQGPAGSIWPTTVVAESPPSPSARFTGSVLVDGVAPPAGTTVEARIGPATCGTATTFMSGSEARYRLDSPALDPGATPNCGMDGAVVTFLVDGLKADQTGSWRNYDLNQLNLTVTTTPDADATPTLNPLPPAAGNAGLSGASSARWFGALVSLAAIAIGAGGLAVVARRDR